FLYRFSIYPSTLLFHIGGSLILFMLFYFLLLMYPYGLGGGDVNLAALVGFALGYRKGILSLLGSCFCALLYGLFLLFFTKKESQRLIPFGPFLFLGTWIIFLTGLG